MGKDGREGLFLRGGIECDFCVSAVDAGDKFFGGAGCRTEGVYGFFLLDWFSHPDGCRRM